MKFLVTGGNGFVGTALLKRLLDDGHSVCNLSRSSRPVEHPRLEQLCTDLLSSKPLRDLLANLPLDGAFHLAGKSSVSRSWQNPQDTYQVNVMGTLNLLEGLRCQANPPPLVFASSGEVYGQRESSDSLEEGDPLCPLNPYGQSKAFAESLLKLWHPQSITARIFSCIGPGQSATFAIPGFCRQVQAFQKTSSPHILKTGNLAITRPLLGIDDLVDALLLLMHRGEPGGIYNVAGPKNYSLESLVSFLKEWSPVAFKVLTDPGKIRPKDIHFFPTVMTTRLRALGWTPRQSIPDVLRSIYESFGS